MENSNTIQTELQSISPHIAALGKEDVYALPEGYFDNLPGNLLRLTSEALNYGNQQSAYVPEGYFDQLAGNILNKIKVQSSGSSLPETFELSAEFAALKFKKTFEIPVGYFEGLAKNIIEKTEVLNNDLMEETNSISHLVGSLERKNLYSVPGGYFDSLPQQANAKVAPSARVVPISKFRSFLKYAAAAAVIGAISIGVIKYSNQQQPGYTAQLESSIQKGIKMDDKKFDETLNTLSQDDILQYLEKNSTDEDVAALTSDLEDKTLPAEDDYLVDEKTLDKFIEAINTKN